MRLLICGSRDWDDERIVDVVIGGFLEHCIGTNETLTVIHGAAPGADSMAGRWDGVPGVEVDPYPAAWDELGKAAGPVRNRRMLREGKPDVVVAFHDDLWGVSRGSRDMAKVAVAAQVPVYLVSRVREVP